VSASRQTLALKRWRDEAAIALALAALACAVAIGGWAWRLDMLVYDLGLAHFERTPPDDIVIIAIDESSLRQVGRWPWRRSIHATLLEKLAELPKPPRAIGIDVVLSEPDLDPVQDQLLAKAMRKGVPVVLPVHWRLLYQGKMSAVEPTPLLRDAAKLGAISMGADLDGVLRDSFLRASLGGDANARYPNFALAMLEAGGEAPHPRAQRLADSATETAAGGPGGSVHAIGDFAIRYVGPRNTFRHLSYADVLKGEFDPEKLAGKYVLIGMTAEGLGDTVATPVNRNNLSMPGIEVHANALYTLRSGEGIEHVQTSRVAVASAAALLMLLLAFSRFGPRVALPLAVSTIPLAVLTSLLALNAGLWFSPVPYCLAAVLAYPLWSWRRLERAVSQLDQEIADLVQSEPLQAPGPTHAAPRARRTDGDALESRLHALRRAGLLVRETRRFFSEALAAMPTAMLIADRSARVALANPRAAALFEVEGEDELLGLDLIRLLAEFTPTAGSFDWDQALKALRPGDEGIAVEVSRGDADADPDASHAHAHDAYVVNVAMVEVQGLQRLIVTLSDVAPVKQAQRDREEVLAFVSHDLRSPASAIMLLADLHLQGRVQTPLPELLEEVKRLAGRTLALSEGLVRTAQVQTQPLNRENLGLAELVEEALADLRARALAAELDLIAEVLQPDTVVKVDRLLLTRAIGNVVGNALRHGPPGSSVLVTASVREGRLRVGVRDHGRGLSEQQIAQLARGDEGAAVGDASGVGLGLLFVQRVARRHGGALHGIAPATGRGAYFEIDLPA
jgi:CHASE2 domain-containing sensor protein/signal transduction histidine kinase